MTFKVGIKPFQKPIIARQIGKVVVGQNQGPMRQPTRLKDDVYVIKYWDKNGQRITQTLQGASAIKELMLHRGDKGFNYIHLKKDFNTAADVLKAEYELFQKGN